MGKPGRPKSDRPVRDQVVSVRLTLAEYHQLNRLAVRRGLSVGELLRAVALAESPAPAEKTALCKPSDGVT